MASVRVNGKTFELFKQVDVSRDLDNFSGEGRIVVSQQVNDQSFIIAGDLIEILIENVPVLTGYVEKINDTESSGSHDISYRVRDKVQDIIDSSVPDNLKNLTGVTTFAQLCNQVVSGLGLDIQVIDEVGATFKDDIKSAEVGKNCYDYLKEYARKAQVFLNTDGKGNILIRRPTTLLKTYLTFIDNFKNNIVESSYSVDNSKRYNKYIVRSNENVVSGNSTTTTQGKKGEAFDSEIRSTRIFERIADSPMTEEECTRAAQEEANIRRIRSFNYSCTVVGAVANDELWEAGKLVRVRDDYKGVNGKFLIRKVSYSDTDRGDLVNLDLTYPDAYLVQAEPTQVEQNSTKTGTTYNERQPQLTNAQARNNIKKKSGAQIASNLVTFSR